MRIALRCWDAIARMIGRKNAGIVTKALVLQDVQGPKRIASDGVTGRAIGCDLCARSRFEYVAGQPQVFAKLLGSLLIDKPMPITVTADLMTLACDFAHQTREAMP